MNKKIKQSILDSLTTQLPGGPRPRADEMYRPGRSGLGNQKIYEGDTKPSQSGGNDDHDFGQPTSRLRDNDE